MFERLTDEEYEAFYDSVKRQLLLEMHMMLILLKKRADEWRKLFGNKFPPGPEDNDNNKLTERKTIAVI